MSTIAEIFTPFFAYVLLVEQEYASGHTRGSYEQIRCDLATLLEEQEKTARHQGMSTQDYQAARFAVISWADAMLQQTAWEDRERWQAFPLQDEYCGAPQAGTEPGEELRWLLAERPGVREVYALCLSLGFRGRSQSGLSDRLLLTDIQPQRSGQQSQVSDAPLLVDDVWTFNFKLTPQPYEVQRHGRYPTRRLMTFAVPLLVLLCLGLWRVWREAPLPCLSSDLSGPVVTQMLAEQPCAQVAVSVEGCTVTLTGRVASEEQQTQIRHVVQSIASSARVDDALHLLPRPFCEVLALLEPVQARADAHALGFAARPNKISAPLVYTEGEDLLIEVSTPAQFASYIYVDFYDNDGRVHYLFFNPELNRPFPAQSVHTLGHADGQSAWEIGPPYGRGLVTVIASKTPLVFPPLEPRDDPGSAALYLARLRQALPQEVAPAEVAATFFFLETQAR
jgi:type IV/VI secretion system ImpK/VasF family protein